jgi:hypothetical protein
MSLKETSESQRKAYQRDGRLGRAYFPDGMTNKPKPKYKPASPPKYPDAPGGNNSSNKKPSDYNKKPRPGNTNPDKAYSKTGFNKKPAGYTSSNPAKNRAYPGSIGQMGKALEDAYSRGQARGARLAGAKTTSIKGRIPVTRQVRPSSVSPVNGKKINPTGRGGGSTTTRGGSRGSGMKGGGGGAFLPGRTGFGEQ